MCALEVGCSPPYSDTVLRLTVLTQKAHAQQDHCSIALWAEHSAGVDCYAMSQCAMKLLSCN
jgi:hypothetical protein